MKERIKKIINSCITPGQLKTAEKYVELAFAKNYIDERLYIYFTIMIEDKYEEMHII